MGFYDKKIILAAALLTLAVTIGLTIYAMTTETDITMKGGLLFAGGAIFIGLTIIGLFFESRFFATIIAAFGTFLFSMYLIYDVQLIIGTKAEKFSLDDYIIAALMIYIDVINIFIQLLELISLIFGDNQN